MITNYKAYVKKLSDIIINPDKIYISITSVDKNIEEVLCTEIELTNTTNSFVNASFDHAIGSQSRWGICLLNQKNNIVSMQPGETGKIVFYAPQSFFEKEFQGDNIRMKFILESKCFKR